MEQVSIKFLNELVMFVEYCQDCISKRKISLYDYYIYTAGKINFVRTLLEDTYYCEHLDELLKVRLKRVYFQDRLLSGNESIPV